jgi:hypothetical protein
MAGFVKKTSRKSSMKGRSQVAKKRNDVWTRHPAFMC